MSSHCVSVFMISNPLVYDRSDAVQRVHLVVLSTQGLSCRQHHGGLPHKSMWGSSYAVRTDPCGL